MSRSPRLLRSVFLGAPLALVAISVASSMPILMDRYNEHPQSRPQNRDQCVICHVYQDGSGPLTAFGKKYDRADLEFTPALVGEYANLFVVDGQSGVSAGPDPDRQSAAVPVPGNEPFDARKYYLGECKECHGKYGDGDPFQGVPAFATEAWFAERSPLTDELLDIILFGKNKMIGHNGKIDRADAAELLALIRIISEKYK